MNCPDFVDFVNCPDFVAVADRVSALLLIYEYEDDFMRMYIRKRLSDLFLSNSRPVCPVTDGW